MVATKEIISFSFLDQETEIDYIPLAEVQYVKEMRDTADFNLPHADNAHDGSSEAMHVLQIATDPNGHNSGRAYYLRAKSTENYEHILKSINKGAKVARRAAEAKNTFRRVQYKVRKMYESNAFQAVVAIMIGGVCPPIHFQWPAFLH